MSMKELVDLAPLVLTRAPGAAEPVVVDALRRAAQEFCESTRLWRYTDDFESTGEEDLLVAPHESEIVEIESARFEDRPLEPKSLAWLDEHRFGWRSYTADATQFITQSSPDSIMLVPMAKGRLSVTLTLKPSDDAELVPKWLADKHSRILADGAIAELMLIPLKEYSNPSMATAYYQRFRGAIDRLSSKGYQGQQRAAVRSKPQFF